MVKGLALAGLTLALASNVLAQSSGRQGHGMVGKGIAMYEPECAHACRGGSPRAGIDCGDGEEHAAGHHGGVKVTPECMAVNEPWLKTVAYCIYQKCQEIDNATFEFYWQTELISRFDEPQPKWSYQESLHQVFQDRIPTDVLQEDAMLHETVLVDEQSYLATANGNTGFRITETWHVNFNLILLLTGAGIPIACSLMRFVPIPQPVVTKFYAYVIDPPLIGSRHNLPVFKNLAIMPTRGQALFLLYIFIINIVASFVRLETRSPNSWWGSKEEEYLALFGNRAGMLSFGNLPLLILYAGRNNILLWLTNWSHSTFLLLHRWIAFICVSQAVVHSAVYLDMHRRIYKDHSTIASVEYWYWGIIATLALVLIMPFSILPIRQRMYELFHATHIVLVIITIAGCWYHIIWRYERQWGYEVWVLVAIGVWVFDWLIRALRLLQSGVKKAYVSKVDEDYLRVDLPGVEASGHVYLYFPTLNWRLWESHPFSVIGHGPSCQAPNSVGVHHVEVRREVKDISEIEAPIAATGSRSSSSPSRSSDPLGAVGTTLYIRQRTGTTNLLAKAAAQSGRVPVLVEASYGGESRFYPGGGHVRPSAAYPNLITIAGGVGITAVLPILSDNQSLYKPLGTKKLFWGVRASSTPLVASVEGLFTSSGVEIDTASQGRGRKASRWGDVAVQISIGERFDFRSLLEDELSENSLVGGTTVLVCGPPGMADEVRNIVTALARHGTLVRYADESFSW